MNGFRSTCSSFAIAASFIGCGAKRDQSEGQSAPLSDSAKTAAVEEAAAVRAKLDPADRALVEAQEWCAVQNDERLGSMGATIKVELRGQPVFLCCKGCKRKAEANPDATLAKVEELKAKKNREKQK